MKMEQKCGSNWAKMRNIKAQNQHDMNKLRKQTRSKIWLKLGKNEKYKSILE